MTSRKRPNFLLITTDQQRGDAFGFEGRRVHTPFLDRMAETGTRFSSCITPNPVCQPARASMLTGLLPNTHGVSDNGIDLEPSLGERGFAGALSASGYRTALIGKAHFATSHTFEPTGTPECRFSMERFGEDWHGPYMGFDHVELVVEGHNVHLPLAPPNGQHYERYYHRDGRGPHWDRMHGQNGREVAGDPPQTWHSCLPPAMHNSTWVADRTIAQLAETSHDRPFCIWASFPDPHHPFDCPLPWSLLHSPEDVDLPAERTLDLDRRPWWHRATLEGVPDIRGDLAAFRRKFSTAYGLSDDALREVIANYYGMISLIDDNVGRILATLADRGLADDTIVIFTSDHGDWLGDHGLLLKGPMNYDGLLRVGCLMTGPGIPQGNVVNDPVSTLDLGATLLDYAGAAPLMEAHGRSLRGLVEGREQRDFALSEWQLRPSRSGVELDLRTVRTERFRLSVDRLSGAGEMYDLKADPNEMDNLFDDQAHADDRGALLAMLDRRPADERPGLLPQVGMA